MVLKAEVIPLVRVERVPRISTVELSPPHGFRLGALCSSPPLNAVCTMVENSTGDDLSLHTGALHADSQMGVTMILTIVDLDLVHTCWELNATKSTSGLVLANS